MGYAHIESVMYFDGVVKIKLYQMTVEDVGGTKSVAKTISIVEIP